MNCRIAFQTSLFSIRDKFSAIGKTGPIGARRRGGLPQTLSDDRVWFSIRRSGARKFLEDSRLPGQKEQTCADRRGFPLIDRASTVPVRHRPGHASLLFLFPCAALARHSQRPLPCFLLFLLKPPWVSFQLALVPLKIFRCGYPALSLASKEFANKFERHLPNPQFV